MRKLAIHTASVLLTVALVWSPPSQGQQEEDSQEPKAEAAELEVVAPEAEVENAEVEVVAPEAEVENAEVEVVAPEAEVENAEVEVVASDAEAVVVEVKAEATEKARERIRSPSIPAEKKGDIVKLKSGVELTNVQVVRATALVYEIEIMEGVAPLVIQRKQVLSVEYDEYEPLRERRRRELFPERAKLSVTLGEKIAPELLDKLTAKLSNRPIAIEREDLIKTLAKMGRRVGVEITIHNSVKALKRNTRLWDVRISETTTLIELLQDHVLKTFDDLVVEFNYDKVILITKKAAAAKGN